MHTIFKRCPPVVSDMIVVSVVGGLGNQMFQYSLGRALSLQHDIPLKLDVSWFDNMGGHTPRSLQLTTFPSLNNETRPWSRCTPSEKHTMCHVSLPKKLLYKAFGKRALNPYVFLEPSLDYHDDILVLKTPCYLSGYWQDEKYFKQYQDQIFSDFRFEPLRGDAQELARQLSSTSDSVSVHIRRGDYASDASILAIHGLCPPAYYAEAIDFIKDQYSGAALFVFSDDKKWVRDHFDSRGLPFTIVDLHGEDDCHHDMHLMTLCRHHIVANSSFSWWGAWLSTQDGITIAPKRWYAEPSMAHFNPAPAHWMCL